MAATNTQKNIRTQENEPGMSYSAIGFLQTCLMASTTHLFKFGIPINGIEVRLKGFEVIPAAIMGTYATNKIIESLNLDDDTDYIAEVINGGFVGVIIPQLLHAVHPPLSFSFEAFMFYSFLYEENLEHPNLARERTKYFIETLETIIKYIVNSEDIKQEKFYDWDIESAKNFDQDKYKKFYDNPETKKRYENGGLKESYSYDEFVELIAPPEVRYKGIKVISISKEAKYKSLIVDADDAVEANLNSIEEQYNPAAASSVTPQEVEIVGETSENTDL
jgi:hypothetical protein